MTDTQVRVAVVTGASGGIGRTVALRLARDGFAVVLNYAGNAGNAEAGVAEIKAADGHAFAVQADVSQRAPRSRRARNRSEEVRCRLQRHRRQHMRFPGEVTRWHASIRFDGVDVPVAGNTFQLMRPPLVEPQT